MKLYGTNDWGIVVFPELIPETIKDEQLKNAGFEYLDPVSGEIYMDAEGDYLEACRPFWFLPIEQPGLFEAPYEGIEDIEREVIPCLPELFEEISVEETLGKINIIFGGDD